MGATKKGARARKTVKKKAPRKRTSSPIPIEDVSLVLARSMVGELEELSGKFHALLADTEDAVFGQDLMAFKLVLDKMSKAVEDARDVFKSRAKDHYQRHGEFEVGRIAITFPEKSSCRPKWKDECVLQGKQVAGLQDESFDEKVFVAEVQGKYAQTVSMGVELTESAA